VVQEKDRENQPDQSGEILRLITYRQGGKECPQTIKRRKANWIVHVLRRNCLTKHVTEGHIKLRTGVTEKRGRRHKLLLDGLKEKIVYLKLKEKAPHRTL
jgi:hypothetical protein